MTPEDKAAVRKAARIDAFNEIIAGYDQLLEIIQKGGAAQLTGHAYDPEENEREVMLLQNLKKSLVELRDKT